MSFYILPALAAAPNPHLHLVLAVFLILALLVGTKWCLVVTSIFFFIQKGQRLMDERMFLPRN